MPYGCTMCGPRSVAVVVHSVAMKMGADAGPVLVLAVL
jgi:hypothetical protein